MLDGGGSTQLRCGANAYVSSSRVIPQTIGVIAGSNSVPSTPSNVRVDSSTQTDITIAWDDTSNETGYKIYKWDWVSSFIYFDSVGANITSFTDNTLGCDNEAYYEVSAYNANGESVHAGWVHGYTQACSTLFDLFLPLIRR
jgi:fibronectin type 3 domain-containing protein